MMMLLDPLVRVSLVGMVSGLLLMVHGHLLLHAYVTSLSLIGSHFRFVLAKRLLMVIDNGRVRVERFGMLRDEFLKFRQLLNCFLVLAFPRADLVPPRGVLPFPLPIVGLNAVERKNFPVHDQSPSV
jgi:hypothetical protein